MHQDAIKAFVQNVQRTAADRQRVKQLVAAGRWQEAEPDSDRSRAYAARHRSLMSRSGAESIVGTTEDFLRVSFLSQGADRARSVGYVEVNYGSKSEIGTGFMVSPQLFLTNRHVVENEAAAHGTQVAFFRELDEHGVPKPVTTFLLDPTRFALFSPDDQFDYALVALGQRQSGLAAPSELGFCALSDQPDKHVIGMNTNIIQHPSGWPKMISVRNNILTARTDHTLLYETDTEQGSSGSPVFNDDWQLVALHHWGEPFLDQGNFKNAVPLNVNEGVRISAIYRDLASRLDQLPGALRALLQQALGAPSDSPNHDNGPRLSPSRRAAPRVETAPATTPQAEHTMADSHNSTSSIKLVIPLEITLRIGDMAEPVQKIQSIDFASMQSTPAAAPLKVLTRGAEAVQVDQDYTNRPGYDPKFIPGLQLPLPNPSEVLAKQIGPLRPEEQNADAGELKYEHFSLKMNRSRRIAVFTATNIDGATYLSVDRKSGHVNSAEGEVWFKDPRISASFFLDQTFYSVWSTYFDRGHLTRRSDPTWGSTQEAQRANADTFHFTNCSPQHFRFNQSARYWQGLERYVLENGVLADESKRRICVFQGPIFDDKIDLWADDVQIPSSFFKVVVWRGTAGPKAVGLVVDQLKLLFEARRSLGAPQPLPAVDVNHWRVPIEKIGTLTNLDFGDAVRAADTIRVAGQPNVGEARVLIKSFQSIHL
jgi:endonuclease G, mitochondrial